MIQGCKTPVPDYGYKAFEKVITMIAGKWKLRILYILTQQPNIRYGELKRQLSTITHKMLSAQLKELESDKLINRKEYPQVPPKVEYSLTEIGLDLIPVYIEFGKWIMKYHKDLTLNLE